MTKNVKSALKSALDDLYLDFKLLHEKHGETMPEYEFAYTLIKYSTKLMLDISPAHKLAHETIKTAYEEGIKWHVDDLNK